MLPYNDNERFCVRHVRVPGPAVIYCSDLDNARAYARFLSFAFNDVFEVYLTSVYYGKS